MQHGTTAQRHRKFSFAAAFSAHDNKGVPAVPPCPVSPEETPVRPPCLPGSILSVSAIYKQCRLGALCAEKNGSTPRRRSLFPHSIPRPKPKVQHFFSTGNARVRKLRITSSAPVCTLGHLPQRGRRFALPFGEGAPEGERERS